MLRCFLFVLTFLPLALFPGDGPAVKLFNLSVEDVHHFKSDFKQKDLGEVGFHLAKVRVTGPLCANRERRLGFLLGYSFASVGWGDNEFFSQEDFHNLELGLRIMSCDFAGWNLKGGVSGVFDLCNGNIGSSNTLYKTMFWAVYDYSERLDIHIGFLGKVGLLDNSLLPIMGVDWKASNDWILSLVFPVKIGITYLIDENWSLLLRPRFEKVRHRLSANETASRGFFEYRNYGGEVSLQYKNEKNWEASLFAGWCVGGSTKIWDSTGNNGEKNKFDSGPHIGGSAKLNF